ncbi:MAG: exo-alpha-sialidase [Planctomycetes bacterium]|nr:exo-alpha-sialidase [Planctomycetota bacterium]
MRHAAWILAAGAAFFWLSASSFAGPDGESPAAGAPKPSGAAGVSRGPTDVAAPPRLDAAEEKPAADLSKVPGVVIDHQPASSGLYIGSPSLAVLPGGRYVASHDLFGPKSVEHERALTRVFESSDRGRSWKRIAEVQGQFWSTLFVHRADLYLMGTWKHHGNLIIRRSTDGGRTWTEPRDAKTGLLAEGQYHTAPVPLVVHRGRLWRAFEDAMGGQKWGERYRAFVMSMPVDADPLDRSSWTFTNVLARDPAWLGGEFAGWLEGNAVADPAGRIANILRVDLPPPGGKAALVRVSEDGRSAAFDPETGFIDFPGAAKKFTIRRDPSGEHYWSLVNYIPPKHQGPRPGGVRNTLALTRSKDLLRWEVRCIVLYHPDVARHGFQYVDWQFEGDDIIAASRTAYDDGLGGARNHHDANLLTFHRIEGFRELTLARSVVAPQSLGMGPSGQEVPGD